MNTGILVLVMDVDGTLTDGKIYMGADGEVMKEFHVKDGYGIAQLLPSAKITPVIMTGRESKIIEKRCQELNIRYLYQGINDKYNTLKKILSEWGIGPQNVAYIGDDLNDLEVIKYIQACGGITGCPSNAAAGVRENCNYVCQADGGLGAVREFIEWLIEVHYQSNISVSI